MQFKAYKSNKTHDELIQLLSNINDLNIYHKIDTEDHITCVVECIECIGIGEFPIKNPVRFNISIMKTDTPVVMIELISTLSNNKLKMIEEQLKLDDIVLKREDMIMIYHNHVLKLLQMYVITKRGNIRELESKTDVESCMDNISEILAITFIPKIESCDTIPVAMVKKEGIFITDVDYNSSVEFINGIISNIR